MLTGADLGAALRRAIELENDRRAAHGQSKLTQTEIAAHFGIRQGSVSEWLKYGRISKDKIPALVQYFSAVARPSHWGLPNAWDESPLTADALRVALAYMQAGPDVQKLWLMQADAVLRSGEAQTPAANAPAPLRAAA